MRNKLNSVRLKDSARLFAALGDRTRLILVSCLCERGPQSITQLTSSTEVTRQAVTKHLNVMEDVGLVLSHRDGREQVWELQNKRLEIAQEYLNLASNRWDHALARLKAQVED